MASLNKVQIIGNLGKDPETRYLPSGDAVCNFSVATTETWKDKASGEKKEATEWHRVACFGKLAEIAEQYLRKGSQVYIEGRIRTRKWTDKDGNDRYSTEIAGDRMLMLGGKPRGDDESERPEASSRKPSAAPATEARKGGGFDEMDDDIPF